MKTRTYVPRQPLFVGTSLLVFLALLLAACGGTSTSGGAVTPTPGKTGTLQTSCPAVGTARAAVMAPLALGRQNTVVYSEVQGPLPDPTSVTLKRYTVSTRTTTPIVTLPHTNIYTAQISTDGQWVLLYTLISHRGAIQLVRMDGRGLQTLYCGSSGGFGWMQWSPDNKYVAFIDTLGDQTTWTFKLLNVVTGAIQTTGYDGKHLLYVPLEWLDKTHVYVSSFTPGTVPSNLYLLDTRTGEKQLILNTPPYCFDAASSVDGTQLFTSITSQCGGSGGSHSIQVQPATGGPTRTIFSTPTDAITALRVASKTTLLLIIHNANTQTGHNGLWKVNTNGTGLTGLLSDAAIIKDPAHERIGFAGANVSRDGAFYSLEVFFEGGTADGPNRLLIGSMSGGAPVTFASSPGAWLVGWTTM